MNFTNNNDDRVLLQELQELLAEALQEQKRANLRVNRLQTQVKIIAQRCGHSYHDSSSASNKNTHPTTNQSFPSNSPTPLNNQSFLSNSTNPLLSNSPTPLNTSRSTTPEQSMEAKSHFLDTATSMLPDGWSTAIDATTQKTYFFNATTNVVQWTAPTHSSNTVSPFSQNNNSPEVYREMDNGETTRRRSVYDKLTDHTMYTGIHRTINKNTEQHSSLYNGSTNTNSNELFHDSSDFLVRDDFDEDGQRYRRWKA